MNDKFAIGFSLTRLLKETFEKFVSKLIYAEKALVGTLISNENRTRLLEARWAKIANLEGGALEVKSLKVAEGIEAKTLRVEEGLRSLTDEQMEELKAIITGGSEDIAGESK